MNDATASDSRWIFYRKRLPLVAFAAIGIVALWFVLRSTSSLRDSEVELKQLRQSHNELSEIAEGNADYMHKLRKHLTRNMELVELARTEVDIPNLKLRQFVPEYDPYFNRLKLWVPKGDHVLQITGYWCSQDAFDEIVSKDPPAANSGRSTLQPRFFKTGSSKKWKIRLQSENGYEFAFRIAKKRLSWNLKCQDPEVKTVAGRFPVQILGFFKGEQYNQRYLPFLPREIHRGTDLSKPIVREQTLLTFGAPFDKKKGESWRLLMKVTISGDGDSCFARQTAIDMMRNGLGDLVVPGSDGEYFLNLKSIEKLKAQEPNKQVLVPQKTMSFWEGKEDMLR